MGYDLKYGRVTVERIRLRPIADDEPVMVFRAQDKLLPELIDMYEGLCSATGSPEEHIQAIRAAREAVVTWQADHYTQQPGSTSPEQSRDDAG